MAAKHTRQAIASAIEDTMSGWVVYPEPPETITGKGVVIGPRDPYRSHATYREWFLHLRVSALIPRATLHALDLLDDALDGIIAGLTAHGDAKLDSIGQVSVMTEGSTEFVVAAVDITVQFSPAYEPEED